jgi:hypothetical protein
MAKKGNTTGHNFETKKGEYWDTEENLLLIEEWARTGLIIADIANNMGISETSFYSMKKKFPRIDDAYRKGKTHADIRVVNAYYRLATGYTTEEITKEVNEFGELVTTKVQIKEISPNEKAASQWIKNRMPDFMKDNQLTEDFRKKIQAETELLKAKTAALKGVSKDSSHLDSLVKLLGNVNDE